MDAPGEDIGARLERIDGADLHAHAVAFRFSFYRPLLV
jgi:hypothetical protein